MKFRLRARAIGEARPVARRGDPFEAGRIVECRWRARWNEPANQSGNDVGQVSRAKAG